MTIAAISRVFAGVGMALVLAQGQLAMAWGDQGHRIIAAIAYGRLSPQARDNADALLAGDRKDTLTGADFISRSTWADKLLSDPRGIARGGFAVTRHWHYAEIEIHGGSIDKACLPMRRRGVALPSGSGLGADCILNKVEQFTDDLRNPASRNEQKIFALKFLINLVGDMHQPLHVAQDHDFFGQHLLVQKVSGAWRLPDNLHDYWGTKLVGRIARAKDPDSLVADRITDSLSSERIVQWSLGSPGQWVAETVEVARQVAYDFTAVRENVDDRGVRTKYITPDYEERALASATEQMAKAGIRLAALLEEALSTIPLEAKGTARP